MRVTAGWTGAIRILHVARYFDSMMESKVDLMAHEPDLAFFRVRPSNFHDPYGGRRTPASSDASGALSIPFIGRPDDPHRTLYRTLTFALPRFKPHIIHAEEEPDSLTALQIVFARRLFAPTSQLILHTWQNVDRPKKFHVKAVIRATLRASDAVLCANEAGIGLLSAMGYRGVTRVLMPQGVDTHVFSPTAGAERSERFTLLYAGRFAPEKGLDTLFDAIARLGAPLHLILLGAGQEEREIERRIKALGSLLSAEIIPPRPHAEMVGFLAKAHALVLPSKSTTVWQEQFGRVLVEAMACKCPVIGSDSGAIPEVVGPGGLIFREGDPEDLAECIGRLMGSEVERTRLAEAGYHRAVTVYSQEQIALETAGFYREMARRKEES